MKTFDLGDLMSMAQQEREPDPPKILPEAAVMRLRELAEAYAKGCTFKVGDLVTVRPGTVMTGVGDPHVVMEVIAPRQVFDTAGYGSHAFGARIDMRVICIDPGGNASPYWVESWYFETYMGPGL